MDQLLAHLVGDYVLQTHWLAIQKKSRLWVAFLHAMVYTLPFLAITLHPTALLAICLPHAIIDRFSLANYWCQFYGVGCTGRLWDWLSCREPDPLAPQAPDYLRVWLVILVDNTMHLALNHYFLDCCPLTRWPA